MVEYLTLFDTHAEYLESKSGLTLPNVSSCLDDYKAHFNGLPYDYEVEYLKSNGTQYVDTEIDFYYRTQEIEISIEAQFDSASTRQLFGANGYGFFGVNANGKFEGVGITTTIARDDEFHSLIHRTNPSLNKAYLTVDSSPYSVNSSINGANPSGYRCFLFAIGGRDNAEASFFCNASLKMCSITIGDEKVRDYIPVVKDGVGYMYDKVSRQLFGNSGSGAFIIGPRKDEPLFDAEVEWIKSSGNAYMNLGVIGNTELNYEIKFQHSKSTEYRYIFGSQEADRVRRFSLMEAKNNNFLYGNNNTQEINLSVTAAEKDSPMIIKKSGRDVYINGSKKGTFNASTYTTPGPICMFGTWEINAVRNGNFGNQIQVYYFKIGDLDLIPVRKGTEGYFYDKTSNRLFGNLNSVGNIVPGPDKPFDYRTIYYGII